MDTFYLIFVLQYVLIHSDHLYPSILFIINTQHHHPHHQAIAAKTEQLLLSQYSQGHQLPDILWASRDLHQPEADSAWAIFPICMNAFHRFAFTFINFFFSVESCAEFLFRFPEVEWLVILNENTNFYLDKFMKLIKREKWNPHKNLVFMGEEIVR